MSAFAWFACYIIIVCRFPGGLGNYWSRTPINCVHLPAPRIQFFAIEIARNREGYNKAVYISVQDKGEKGASGGEDGGEKGVDRGGEEKKVEKGADSRGGKEEAVTREGEKEN